MKFVLSLLASMVFLAVCNAEVYHVTKTGSDLNNGSESAPWLTIQKAANTLTAGDTVQIHAGVYSNDVVVQNSGYQGQYIVFMAYPGDEHEAIIDGASFFTNKQSYVVVSGIRIQNASYGVYVEGPASDIIIENNYTYNTFNSGIIAWGVPWQTDPGDYNNLHRIKITGNKVEKACNGGYNECITLANGVVDFEISYNEVFNGGDPINGGEGIDVKEGCKNGTINDNYIHNLTRRGIYIDAGGLLGFTPPLTTNIKVYNNISINNYRDGSALGTHGMAIMTEGSGDVTDIEVYNNFFINNDADGFMIYKHPAGTGSVSNIKITNNTLYGNARHGILINFEGAEDIDVRNNIAYGNTNTNLSFQAGSYVESNNLTSDPLFDNISELNFKITGMSPAVNAGTDTNAPNYDFEGEPRIQGIDIGADQYSTDTGQVDTLWQCNCPEILQIGSTSVASVYFEATEARDIHMVLQNTTDWSTYGEQVKTVTPGSAGLVEFNFVPAGSPPPGSDYRWIVYMTPVEADHTLTIGENIFVPTEVIEGEDEIIAIGAPLVVHPSGYYLINVEFSISEPRELHFYMRDTITGLLVDSSMYSVSDIYESSWEFEKYIQADLDAGNHYKWEVYLAPKNGDLSAAIDTITQNLWVEEQAISLNSLVLPKDLESGESYEIQFDYEFPVASSVHFELSEKKSGNVSATATAVFKGNGNGRLENFVPNNLNVLNEYMWTVYVSPKDGGLSDAIGDIVYEDADLWAQIDTIYNFKAADELEAGETYSLTVNYLSQDKSSVHFLLLDAEGNLVGEEQAFSINENSIDEAQVSYEIPASMGSGQYKWVCYIAAPGADSTETLSEVLYSSTFVEDIDPTNIEGTHSDIQPNISIYPNPVGEKLNIEFADNYSEKVEMVLLNAEGRQVMAELLNISEGLTYEINTESILEAGIYYLHFKTEDDIENFTVIIK